ncbi:MAG: hypothetical protein RR382_02065 [Tannerellaceae bacterium]
MSTLHDILSKEATNKNAIYLYERGNKWVAYEHSAYHFSLIFKMGEIECIGDQVCVALSNSLDFLYSQAMNTVEIIYVGDTEVKIDCGTAFAGFEQWKRKQYLTIQ